MRLTALRSAAARASYSGSTAAAAHYDTRMRQAGAMEHRASVHV
jgi:hypothetical protein